MSGFDPDWLSLREPADRAARAGRLIAMAAQDLAAAGTPVVCDLGAGTGASVRAFAPVFPDATRWVLVDDSADCLARATALGPHVEVRQADLVQTARPWPEDCALVTATALFDLASASWIDRLVDGLAAARLPLLSCLTYDGVLDLAPPHADDGAIRQAFNAHQRGDKGLGGPGCGPDAQGVLIRALTARGYTVETADSPWVLSAPADGALIGQTLAGVANAAAETGQVDPARAEVWRAARASRVPSVVVGHQDLYARPPSRA